MCVSVASLRRRIKGKLSVEFVHQEFTPYSGLEFLRRYLRQHDPPRRLRAACTLTGGDYGGGRLSPLVPRNHALVIDAIARLALRRPTIDVDGTVVRTEATVGWAFRGFNPHHRTLRFLRIARAGRLIRIDGCPVLRMSHSPATEALYASIHARKLQDPRRVRTTTRKSKNTRMRPLVTGGAPADRTHADPITSLSSKIAMICSAARSGVFAVVSTRISACSGVSYGESMPVKFINSPRRAFR